MSELARQKQTKDFKVNIHVDIFLDFPKNMFFSSSFSTTLSDKKGGGYEKA